MNPSKSKKVRQQYADNRSVAVVSTHERPADLMEILTSFAEELGRFVARRDLAGGRDCRRGYSLLDLLAGAAIMAMIWATVYYVTK